jgi:hypothetical protein
LWVARANGVDEYGQLAHGANSGGGGLEITVERELYLPLRRFLDMRFRLMLGRRLHASPPQIFAEEVADVAGNDDGVWTRPDVAALAIRRGRYLPSWAADLHSFEVKTAANLDVRGAHEAKSQSRFAHYPWLVFQAVGRAAVDAPLHENVSLTADALGVGIITTTHPNDVDSWRVQSWPQRSDTHDLTADAFVQERFRRSTRDLIVQHLQHLGWPVDESEC